MTHPVGVDDGVGRITSYNVCYTKLLRFHSECEMRYIVGCIDLLLASGKNSMEPKPARYDDWYDRSQAELKTMVWSQPSIEHSFYKDARGIVHSLSPWRLVDFWSWTREPEPADFRMH